MCAKQFRLTRRSSSRVISMIGAISWVKLCPASWIYTTCLISLAENRHAVFRPDCLCCVWIAFTCVDLTCCTAAYMSAEIGSDCRIMPRFPHNWKEYDQRSSGGQKPIDAAAKRRGVFSAIVRGYRCRTAFDLSGNLYFRRRRDRPHSCRCIATRRCARGGGARVAGWLRLGGIAAALGG